MQTQAEKFELLVDGGFAHDSFLSCFKPLDEFEEEEATWLIPGWLPDGQITTLAADGGIGKTSLWCNIVASVSSGTPCLLDPPGHTRKPQTVAFFTTEDSVRKTLKKKLRLAGANMKNIITPDFLTDKTGELQGFKFGSPFVEQFIRHFKPALCVFDPIQGFVPPEIQMGSRNAMRDCMAPLVALGEECGTTFLIICHTNKRSNASGRSRMADSADLWDISRSVIMAGYTEEQGIRYLSNEKNNYAQRGETILFSIDGDGLVQHEGTSWKRDHEYMQEEALNKSAPKREDCKEFILNLLDEGGGMLPSKDIEQAAERAGYGGRTLDRAKSELKGNGEIKYFSTGSSRTGDRVWFTQRTGNFEELDNGELTPFDEPSPSATQKWRS